MGWKIQKHLLYFKIYCHYLILESYNLCNILSLLGERKGIKQYNKSCSGVLLYSVNNGWRQLFDTTLYLNIISNLWNDTLFLCLLCLPSANKPEWFLQCDQFTFHLCHGIFICSPVVHCGSLF